MAGMEAWSLHSQCWEVKMDGSLENHLLTSKAHLVSSRPKRGLVSKKSRQTVCDNMTDDTWDCSVIHTNACVPLPTCTSLYCTHKNKHTHSIWVYRKFNHENLCDYLTARGLPIRWHCYVKQSILQWNGFQIYGQDPCAFQSTEGKHREIAISNKVLTFGNDLFIHKAEVVKYHLRQSLYHWTTSPVASENPSSNPVLACI